MESAFSFFRIFPGLARRRARSCSPRSGSTFVATVFGFEIGYAQSLNFLPGLLSGLVLSANYTYTDSEGDVFGRTISLPAYSENTFNLMLGYDLSDNVQLYTEFVNLGDEPYVAYNTFGGQRNLLQYEEYSWTGKFGIRARF